MHSSQLGEPVLHRNPGLLWPKQLFNCANESKQLALRYVHLLSASRIRRPFLRLHRAGSGFLSSVPKSPNVLKPVDIHDSFGKTFRGLLRQVVSNPAGNRAMRILSGEFLGVGSGFRMWRPLASPSRVMAGMVMTGPAASRLSRSSYLN